METTTTSPDTGMQMKPLYLGIVILIFLVVFYLLFSSSEHMSLDEIAMKRANTGILNPKSKIW